MIKEKFLNLVNACKNDRDMLDIIESDMRALGEYVYAVHIMETSLPIIRVNYEGQELRDRVEKLDHNRRAHHERRGGTRDERATARAPGHSGARPQRVEDARKRACAAVPE